jgi:hypothetical protein
MDEAMDEASERQTQKVTLLDVIETPGIQFRTRC